MSAIRNFKGNGKKVDEGFLSFIELSQFPIALVSAKGEVAHANPVLQAHCATRPSVLQEIVPTANATRVCALLQAPASEQATVAIETNLILGLRMPVLLSASRLRLPGERLALVQFIPLDGLIEDEAAPTQRESRWRYALEGAGQGVWDHDLVRGKVYYSPAWYRMRGYDPGADIDTDLGPWLERIHPDDRPLIAAATRRQDSGELKSNAFEYRERHRNGHWIWILSRGRPVEWLPGGAVARIVGTDTDITALKEIESQLADEKERLRVTLQSVADGMISTDAAASVSFLNPAAEALTGWTLGEAVGTPLSQVLTLVQEDGTVPICPAQSCMSSGQPSVLEDGILLVHRHGAIRDLRLTSSPLISSAGGVVGAVVVFQDVTRSRNLQRELAHSATHDSLTGLPNRLAFEEALQSASSSARREFREHALCYIDLDHFKRVNDEAGHAAGDELLRQIADVVRKSCRRDDFAGRIGGDEFVVLLMDCKLDSALSVCEKLIASISELVFRWEQQTFRVGASIGVTAVTCRQPSPAQLTEQADAACYAAKRGGRGRVQVHNSI